MSRKLAVLLLVLVVGLLAVTLAMGRGRPRPPRCDCPETITLPNGDVCTLSACGSDCVYTCPLPS